MTYIKVWFESLASHGMKLDHAKGRVSAARFQDRGQEEATAGLVFETAGFHAKTIGEVSRSFPCSESGKMHSLHRSPEFETWVEAFHYDRFETTSV